MNSNKLNFPYKCFYNQEENEIVINLDPGMAFGTGLHPTTQLCLTQVERWLKIRLAFFLSKKAD